MNDNLQKYSPLVLAVFIGVSIVTVTFYSYLYFLYHPQAFKKQTSNPTEGYLFQNPTLNPATRAPNTPTQAPSPVVYAVFNPGEVSWLQFPKVVKISPYVLPSTTVDPNNSPYFGILFDKITYHQVGTFSDGSKLINAIVPSEGMGMWYEVQRFIQTPAGQLYFLTDTDNPNFIIPNYLTPNVKISSLKINEISSPLSFTTSRGKFSLTSFFSINTFSFTELKDPTFVTDTPYGRLYAVYTDVTKDGNLHTPGGIFDRKFWLRHSDDTVKPYAYVAPFLTDDKIPQLTWLDDTKNTQSYTNGFSGKCGVNYGSVIKESSSVVKSFSPVGTTKQGEPIYAISDPSSPVLDDIYSRLDQSVRPDKSTFLQQKNHFLYKDSLGDWLLYISDLNQIQAECGKPVIYLYPTTDTQVSVKVGAHITESEPTYPNSGWSVLAHPNGQLDYQNSSYPNLFWEGTGFGFYNSHFGEGFVVTQQELVSTIKSQLTAQGLNQQEIVDFMDFWQSRLPSSPYIRLTWLNTADMNQLAPLQVSPSPNTTIRVFLEFEGLDKPISLKPQKLSAPKRNGFTLVEWGGLLRK